jgi:hypothetical protein
VSKSAHASASRWWTRRDDSAPRSEKKTTHPLGPLVENEGIVRVGAVQVVGVLGDALCDQDGSKDVAGERRSNELEHGHHFSDTTDGVNSVSGGGADPG